MKSIDILRGTRSDLPIFATIDGNLHFPRGVEKGIGDTAGAIGAFDLLKTAVAGKYPIPSPFYALLDMDGDNMGPVFSHSKARAKKGSAALLTFAAGVQEIVRKHDGVLIYAGADDVNAMLPVETAIHCAMAIRAKWTEVMAKHSLPCTLSGSIVFSDYQNHLGEIRVLAHSRLDAVAKDGMGRDALAIAVAKSGGVSSAWASVWDGNGQPGRFDAVKGLFDYARAAADNRTIASRLPYVVRARFSDILADQVLFNQDALTQLLTKEMGDSVLKELGKTPIEKARAIAEILQPWGRKNGAPIAAERHVGGLLVARFLVQKMLWPYFVNWDERMKGATP